MQFHVLVLSVLTVVSVGLPFFAGALRTGNRRPKKYIDRPEGRIECSLEEAILDEIHGYQDEVDSIIDYVVNGEHKGETHSDLETFTDFFGPRLSGSTVLEDSIDWIISKATQDGFDAVRTESLMVPHWIRGEESASMITPRLQSLRMLGLGNSIGTSAEGITAQIIAVESFEELQTVADQVPGKIVLYNQGYTSYGQSVEYRSNGAIEAAKLGAVASLCRSATDFSIGSPHTGNQNYEDGVPQIPGAALSVEDAALLYRLYKKGYDVTVNLKMNAQVLPESESRNTIIDFEGSQSPEQIVVISGHVDSWDVGTGSMDDAGGCFVSYHAMKTLQALGLQARRTISTIWFTAEEQGIYGGVDYFNQHRNESSRYQLMMESDGGTFNPRGIGFTGTDQAACIMQEILSLTAAINTTELIIGADTPDLNVWAQVDAPRGSLYLDNERYFWFHHSHGDTMEVEDPDTLDRITALWASVAYVAADISVNFQETS